jgi:DNA-binding SARP family transcriptional activator
MIASNDPKADAIIDSLESTADRQQSRLQMLLVGLLRAERGSEADAAIGQLLPEEGHVMSMLAEECCRMLPRLREEGRARIAQEARLRPERWSSALRLVFASDAIAAGLLAEIGGMDDASAVRAAAADHKWLRPYAAALTRRLAPKVLIRDLGAVHVMIGEAGVERNLRRKVLGLLCYLSSRPGMAATREEALEAIWPDLGPDTAGNSLHQTIYFLRRVFEPGYKEGVSAGYLAFDGEVVSLDPELVDSLSRQCWRILGRLRAGDPDSIRLLVHTYRAAYALDFAYEEWAVGYRDNLHAAVLAGVEMEVRSAVSRGDTDRAIELAQAVLAVDPAADAIEFELLRAYKLGGRPAAAAEQYAHYASYLRRELGTEPPSFDEI